MCSCQVKEDGVKHKTECGTVTYRLTPGSQWASDFMVGQLVDGLSHREFLADQWPLAYQRLLKGEAVECTLVITSVVSEEQR